jgi:MFS family permease
MGDLLTFPVAFWRQLDQRGRASSDEDGLRHVSHLHGLLHHSASPPGGERQAAGGDIYGFRVSPAWLVAAFGVLTLGELMLSPMGLALVSKVAPRRFRGIMMGGWFVATAIGNKLTQIGELWDDIPHSAFWLMLSGAACRGGAVAPQALKRPCRI